MNCIFILCLLALSPGLISSADLFNSGKLFVGYLGSWIDNPSRTGDDTYLSNIPAYVNIVIIAFLYPDLVYNGNYDLKGTGLEFNNNGKIIFNSIRALKQRNSGTKVIISVGGGNAKARWAGFSETTIVKFVKDFGFDGVDIDYEVGDPNCRVINGNFACAADAKNIEIITRMRNALPRPYILSMAAYNVGAYGQGDFMKDFPLYSEFRGGNINLLKSPAGQMLDLINVMSYDCGDIDAVRSVMAFKSIFNGKVVAGLEVPPEAWGPHVYTMDSVERIAKEMQNGKGDGVMLWQLGKKTIGPVTRNNPTAEMMAKASCLIFNLKDCAKPLLSAALPI